MVKSTSRKNNKTKVASAAATKKSAKHTTVVNKKGNKKLNAQQEKIMKAMGQLHAARRVQPTRFMVQNMSGNAKTKAGFDKNCGVLKKLGLLQYPDGKTMALTDAGIDHVGEPDASQMTNAKFHEIIKELLSNKGGQILDALVDGNVHDRKATAKSLGYDMSKLSGYNKDLGKMRTLGFLEYIGKTGIQLTDDCFPFDN